MFVLVIRCFNFFRESFIYVHVKYVYKTLYYKHINIFVIKFGTIVGLHASAIRPCLSREEESSRTTCWKGLPGLRQGKLLLGDYNLRRYYW